MKRILKPVSLLLLLCTLLATFTFAFAADGAPVAENLELSTYRGVSVGGRLAATDPEGGALRFVPGALKEAVQMALCEEDASPAPEAQEEPQDADEDVCSPRP